MLPATSNPQNAIFWADDDQDDLDLFRAVLEKLAPEHHLIEFPNGLELLRRLRSQSSSQYPCLIVLDMNMPVLGGKDTLTILKADQDLQNIPVVVFTTSNSSIDRTFCQQLGTEMITKPPTMEQLKQALLSIVPHCKAVQHT